jgi:hypothetical protein
MCPMTPPAHPDSAAEVRSASGAVSDGASRAAQRRCTSARLLRGAIASLLVMGGPAGISQLSAQEVELRGRVVDRETGQPLPDAVVRVPGLGMYTLTDETGAFRVGGVPDSAQTVVVVQLGYGERTLRLQPRGFHIIELTPQPIRLDVIEATDASYVERVMKQVAQARVHSLMGPTWMGGAPVFWRSWDRDQIMAADFDEPLDFLRRGPPRVRIQRCAGLGLPMNRLCVHGAFMGRDGRGGSSSRGAAYLDDRPVGELEDLRGYSMSDFHRVETFGYNGERGIRLYTEGYLRQVALGLIRPAIRMAPAETYLFREPR